MTRCEGSVLEAASIEMMVFCCATAEEWRERYRSKGSKEEMNGGGILRSYVRGVVQRAGKKKVVGCVGRGFK